MRGRGEESSCCCYFLFGGGGVEVRKNGEQMYIFIQGQHVESLKEKNKEFMLNAGGEESEETVDE